METIGPERATAVVGDISDLASASFATLEQITEQHFDQTFGVNVRGTLFTVQKALPLLNDGASVILNSSVRAGDGVAAFGTYAASKAAIRSFARTWANELKDRNIRVNAISPGTIDTPGLDAVVSAEDAPVTKAQFAAGTPLERGGVPRVRGEQRHPRSQPVRRRRRDPVLTRGRNPSHPAARG